MARKPSHLGSYAMPSPEGRVSASLASMGSTGGSIGKVITVSSREAAALEQCRKPRIVAIPIPFGVHWKVDEVDVVCLVRLVEPFEHRCRIPQRAVDHGEGCRRHVAV